MWVRWLLNKSSRGALSPAFFFFLAFLVGSVIVVFVNDEIWIRSQDELLFWSLDCDGMHLWRENDGRLGINSLLFYFSFTKQFIECFLIHSAATCSRNFPCTLPFTICENGKVREVSHKEGQRPIMGERRCESKDETRAWSADMEKKSARLVLSPTP
jgi:hypothetical protein